MSNTKFQETKPVAKKAAPKKPSGIPSTIDKYRAAGWSTQSFSRATLHFIATKGEGSKQKVHFVRVFESHTGIKSPEDRSREENNTFIQNAFSNNATPVYAFAHYSESKDMFDKISLIDINSGSSLRLVAAVIKNNTDDEQKIIQD